MRKLPIADPMAKEGGKSKIIKLFETEHFRDRLDQRGIDADEALKAFVEGRAYIQKFPGANGGHVMKYVLNKLAVIAEVNKKTGQAWLMTAYRID